MDKQNLEESYKNIRKNIWLEVCEDYLDKCGEPMYTELAEDIISDYELGEEFHEFVFEQSTIILDEYMEI